MNLSRGHVVRLLARRRARSEQADERYALTMLGYAVGTRRRIDAAPVRPPLRPTTPRGIKPVGSRARDER